MFSRLSRVVAQAGRVGDTDFMDIRSNVGSNIAEFIKFKKKIYDKRMSDVYEELADNVIVDKQYNGIVVKIFGTAILFYKNHLSIHALAITLQVTIGSPIRIGTGTQHQVIIGNPNSKTATITFPNLQAATRFFDRVTSAMHKLTEERDSGERDSN